MLVFCLIDNDHLVLKLNYCLLLTFSLYKCNHINRSTLSVFDYSWTYIDYTNLPCLDFKEHRA